MIEEKINSTGVNDLLPLATPKKSKEVSSSGRVDINILLDRARRVKEKENKISLIFASLTVSLVFVFGLILSF